MKHNHNPFITRCLFVALFLFGSLSLANAQVVVTPATGGTNLCVGGAYKPLSMIKIREGAITDFTAQLATYVITLPANFEFKPGTGTATLGAVTDIDLISLSVTSGSLTIVYNCAGVAQLDSITLSGLEVRGVNAATASVNFSRSGGTATQTGNATGVQIHGTLSSIAPTATFGVIAARCVNAAVVDLTPLGSPAGGVFSGNGVTGNNFTPATAGVGTHTLTYTYTDGNGCIAIATRNVTVNALPSPTMGSVPNRCINGTNVTLNMGSPAGGVYSGTGVSGTTFSPSAAGAGFFTITYTYTDGNGCVNTATNTATVYDLPGVTFSGLNPSHCFNGGSVTLTGFPSGGTFSGTGITGTTYNPAAAGVGGPYSISYSYTDAHSCTNTVSQNSVVLAAPNVTISGLENGYSVDDNYDDITGTQSPAGGTVSVSGPGVSNLTFRFFPSVAGIGTHNIIRTYVGPNGCTNTAIKTVTVSDNNPGSGLITGLDASYCYNSPVDNISGTPPTGYFTGPGITNTSTGNATFNPAAAGVGFHLITYWYSWEIMPGFEISFPILFSTEVRAVTTPSFFGLQTSYCINSPTDALSGFPSGGTFSGSGISGGNLFSPSAAGLGGKTITYTYTNPAGCTAAATQGTTVFSQPTISSVTGLLSDYCEDAPSSTLNAVPSGGVYSGVGIINGNEFNPALAVSINGAGSLTITYTYTDGNGCSRSATRDTDLHLKPIVSYSGFPANAQYCIDGAVVNLTGTPSGGTFSAVTVPMSPTNTVTAGGVFSPPNAGSGTPDASSIHTIRYTYTDANSCTNFQDQNVQINPLPIVNFSGLDAKYCHVIGQFDVLSPTQTGPTAIFSGNSGVAGSNFFPALAGVGTHNVKFQYTDANGCYNEITKSTIVYARPRTNFIMSDSCEGDNITFLDNSTILSVAGAPSSIAAWNWKFSDAPAYTTEDITRSFPAGPYRLDYTVTSDQGCDSTYTFDFIIGPYPVPDFSWTDICDQAVTTFTDETTITPGIIKNWTWDFDDAGATAATQNTTHVFTAPGIYDVILEVESMKGCISKDTQKVFILPSVSSFPYSIDFESGDGGWIPSTVYDTASTWALGTPNKAIINAAASGSNAWVTDLTGHHKVSEQSYVYSPCYDFTSLTRPMISMNIWSATRQKSSGVVLQSSVDEGNTWQVVGVVDDGLEWYNESVIFGKPGGQDVIQYGWSFVDSNGYRVARHSLNDLAGEPKVRFRLAFGAENSQLTEDGFAFDDVWIGDRSRVVLVEHFTNSANPNTIQENNFIKNVVNTMSNDAVAIHYHSGDPNGDNMFLKNVPDNSSRLLYYGVSQAPRSALDGNYYSGNSLGLTTTKVDIRSLYDPGFTIDLNSTITSSNVSANVTIHAARTISNTVVVHIAVVERNVSSVTGMNGETNFQWVLTKLMPDGAGTSFAQNWNVGDQQSMAYNWTFGVSDVYDVSQLGVIVFVQDYVTKEIYQTAYQGPSGPTTDNFPAAVNIGSDVVVYPNPANDQAVVYFTSTIGTDGAQWSLTDVTGRTVQYGIVGSGDNGFDITTTDLPAGMYVLSIGKTDGKQLKGKIVVKH